MSTIKQNSKNRTAKKIADTAIPEIGLHTATLNIANTVTLPSIDNFKVGINGTVGMGVANFLNSSNFTANRIFCRSTQPQ